MIKRLVQPCVCTIIPIDAHTCNEYYYMQEVLYCFKEVFSSELHSFTNSHLIFYNRIYIPIILKMMLAYFVITYLQAVPTLPQFSRVHTA